MSAVTGTGRVNIVHLEQLALAVDEWMRAVEVKRAAMAEHNEVIKDLAERVKRIRARINEDRYPPSLPGMEVEVVVNGAPGCRISLDEAADGD